MLKQEVLDSLRQSIKDKECVNCHSYTTRGAACSERCADYLDDYAPIEMLNALEEICKEMK